MSQRKIEKGDRAMFNGNVYVATGKTKNDNARHLYYQLKRINSKFNKTPFVATKRSTSEWVRGDKFSTMDY